MAPAVHSRNQEREATRQIDANPCEQTPEKQNAQRLIAQHQALTGLAFLYAEKKRAPRVGLALKRKSPGNIAISVLSGATGGAVESDLERLAADLRGVLTVEQCRLLAELLVDPVAKEGLEGHD